MIGAPTAIGAALLLAGIGLACWAVWLWRRWYRTKNTPILDRVRDDDYKNVVPLAYLPRRLTPTGRRWPQFSQISGPDEAEAYARLSRARSLNYLLLGEIIASLGSALTGSVAFDFLSQGMGASPGKQVAFFGGLFCIGIGLLTARFVSPRWNMLADGYSTSAARPSRPTGRATYFDTARTNGRPLRVAGREQQRRSRSGS